MCQRLGNSSANGSPRRPDRRRAAGAQRRRRHAPGRARRGPCGLRGARCRRPRRVRAVPASTRALTVPPSTFTRISGVAPSEALHRERHRIGVALGEAGERDAQVGVIEVADQVAGEHGLRVHLRGCAPRLPRPRARRRARGTRRGRRRRPGWSSASLDQHDPAADSR